MKSHNNILSLFPIPVLSSLLPSSLASIIPWLDSQPFKETPKDSNYGTTSVDTYILDNSRCTEIRNFILQEALTLGKTLGYICDEYKLTQSWITHKFPNQSHHPHSHSNSLISGVFFYGSSFKSHCSAIVFHKPERSSQVNHPQDFSMNSNFSSETMAYTPIPGEMLLFPSHLIHSVPTNTTNEVRKSLAFNIVPKKGLGQESSLNELKFN